MEQTSLQQQIENRATKRLQTDLLKYSNSLQEIGNAIGKADQFKEIFYVWEHYGASPNYKTTFRINNEPTQKIYDELLPKYIEQVTTEIMDAVDHMKDILEGKTEQVEF